MGSTEGTFDRDWSLATVLAIGTAYPSQMVPQTDFPDFYFRVTGSEHKLELKEKLKRICERSMIQKRHVHITEDTVKQNPNMINSMTPSLNARLDIMIPAVPKLAEEAATKAINEWGQPISSITHLIFCTTSGVDAPGADYHLTKLLGLSPTVKRVMLYQQGCIGGGTVLRVAKDLAENDKNARILAVCSEINSVNAFREPTETNLHSLLGMGIFGDGAAAIIIGASPNTSVERPLFQLVSTACTLLPDSGDMVAAHLREAGLMIRLSKDVGRTISDNIEKCLVQALTPVGISDWNSIFWVPHPGGPAILDKIEAKLNLRKDKMNVTRKVLGDFGNMSSPTLWFILDEMRRRSLEEGKNTTGEGFDWGVMFGFGPGITVEALVLRSFPIISNH